jgi:hypothetical protein
MKVEPKELFDGMWECHHIRQVREFIKNQTKDTE